MFNEQHISYIVISGLLTAVLLVLARIFVKDERSKNNILKFWAILTVAIHYSNLWVDYFTTGGNATVENNQILPVYPCNVVMWMLLVAALIQNKKRLLFQILGEFCFYGGLVCGVIGIVLNANFDNTPTLADFDILKGLLSHSTMLFGCLYMLVGGFIRIRVFNAVSVTMGLGSFLVCGLGVDYLYEHFGMEPPDGMFLRSNPYLKTSPIILGIWAVVLLFCGLALWELRLPREERWYSKLHLRN
ncbi:MAG: YwaF family protein [Oscillospiraceae bacterium]|nr:YwaF family protein [Oscillospiraceae bacterium]